MILTVLVLLFCTPFLWWFLFLQKFKSLNSIPGPKPIPFIGNVTELGSTPQDLLKNTLKLYKQYGDVFKVYIANEVKVFIANPDYIENVMNSNIHITKSNGYDLLQSWINDGLLMSTGRKWKIRRKMITPSFHFKILDKFLEIFNSNGDILTEKISKEVGKDSFDIYQYINLFSLDIICETSMGIKVAAQDGKNKEYVDAIRDYLDIFIVRFFSPWEKFDTLFRFSPKYNRHKRCLEILHNFADTVIATSRAERLEETKETNLSDDGIKKKVALLEMLLESEDVHNLTHEDIKEEINTFLFEGHDTTTSAISFAFLALADHKDIQQKVYEEIASVVGDQEYVTMQHLQDTKYLDMVIKEVQRMYPTVPIVERRLETSFNICGTEFPKDTTLNLFLYGIHQNEKYFPEPHKFDPNRFLIENQSERHNFAFVPFSAGPRNCVGQKYAWLDIKAVVIKVLQKYRLLPVPNYKPDIGMAATLKSYNGIRIRLEPRHK